MQDNKSIPEETAEERVTEVVLPQVASTRGVLAYLTAGFLVMLQFVLQGSVSLMVPEIKADLQLQEAGVGLLSSIFFYPYVFLQIPSGWLLSRYGCRTLIMGAGLVMALGCMIQSSADTALMMMLGRAVTGIGAAPVVVCFLGTIERFFIASMFGALAAGMEMLGMIGACFGDFLIPESIALWGWRYTLKIFVLLCLIPVILSPLLMSDRQGLAIGSDGESNNWKSVFRNGRIWVVSLYSGLMFAVINAFAALWAIPFLEADPECVGKAGHMVGMVFLGAAVGAPMLGWLADHGLNIRNVMMSCAILTVGLFMVILSGILPPSLHYPMLLVLGLCASAYMLPFVLVKHWLVGEALSMGLALVNTVSVMVGALFYQPVIGWLLGLHADVCMEHYRQALLIIPAGVAVAACLVMTLRFPPPRVVTIPVKR
ncbi:MFS transporter [Parendozoicomonas haliclonae]|uniref:D-galactonate transporter n=1 Tax=Parendozoicomonas haliclonae TaxID=1960125 RepID=A0A1X7AK00_9GAMM|nr:MFS transporter [Parendozoicomonas haliclonae]SMA47406.1 D-galactonate transporter [Parendozoicomonas haliclonae]